MKTTGNREGFLNVVSRRLLAACHRTVGPRAASVLVCALCAVGLFGAGTAGAATDVEVNKDGPKTFVLGPQPGGAESPWKVGGTAGTTDLVEAWTNGSELVIQGSGTVTNLSKVAKGGLKTVTITKSTVTGAEADAFQGIGADGTPVALTLPDGWKGALPDEDGKWYGAFATLTGYPFMVRNVTFRQRYPWNGLVDIAFDLTGTGQVQVAVSVLTNDVRAIYASALEGGTTFDLGEGRTTNGVKLVWNAATDLPAGFKAQDVQIKVTVIPPGQLWENGPIWADRNVGANEPWECGYYFWWGDTVGYTNTNPNGGGQWVPVDGNNTTISFSQSDTTANQTYDKDVDTLVKDHWIDDSGNLVVSDDYANRDAARAHCGGTWRMPTADEVAMLADKTVCQQRWVGNYNDTGVSGYVVNGKAGTPYANNEVFFPAAGSATSARPAATGHPRRIRTIPSTRGSCTSIRAISAGSTATATTGSLFVQFEDLPNSARRKGGLRLSTVF